MRAPLTPIKAFIHDAEQFGATGGTTADDPRLSLWLTVAQAAVRLVALPASQRTDYIHSLTSRALPARAGRPTQVEGDGRAPTDAVSLLAERLRMEAEDMEVAGCFELALVTVSAVCHLVARASARTRLLATAHLGRVNRQLGDLDTAVDCYQTVTDDAGRAGDGSVAAHGFIGLGNVAHARGNRPAQKNFFEQALNLAVLGSPVELSAHQGLMIAANALGEWPDALLHGWRAHDLAPSGSDVQLEILANLAVTAFEAGFYQAALSGYEFVLERTLVTRIRLPGLSVAMRAAARIGSRLKFARLEKLGRVELNAAQPLDVARFLLYTGESWQHLQDYPRAEHSLREAGRLAEQYGFHEFSIRAEQLLAANTKASARAERESVTPFDSERMRHGISRLEALATA
jgi:tetratricopeptide (TPR) repeat protein